MLLVAAASEASKAERAALHALASQVALALDSAVLSDEVHRRRGEARFASLVRHASDLITIVDADTTVTYQSPSSERVIGYEPEELLGRPFDRLAVPGDRERLAQRIADRRPVTGASRSSARSCAATATRREFEILFTDLSDDEYVGGIVLNARDVSERKAFEAELAHQAFHDPVTGLANRAMFSEQVRQAVARARRESAPPRSSSSTSTTSRRSTTRSVTPPATRCSSSSRAGWTRARAAPTWRHASAATSSRSCSRTSRRARLLRTRPSASSSCSRSRCRPDTAR